jgi:hypothetical protein
MVETALAKHGLKATTAKKRRLLESAQEEAEETLAAQAKRSKLGEMTVEASDLQGGRLGWARLALVLVVGPVLAVAARLAAPVPASPCTRPLAPAAARWRIGPPLHTPAHHASGPRMGPSARPLHHRPTTAHPLAPHPPTHPAPFPQAATSSARTRRSE